MVTRIALAVVVLAGCHDAQQAPAPATAPAAPPARIHCPAGLNTHKGTSYQLDLHRGADGSYDLSFVHTNGLGCAFQGELPGMTCVFHDAQPLAFACTRHATTPATIIEDASFELSAYQRIEAGRPVSGRRILARLSRYPSLTEHPVDCSQAGLAAGGTVIDIDFDATGCVVEPGVTVAAP